MRNLKKVLSLVLALAMVLSICMVGAGAVNYDDFTDEESISKKQAVETLVSLDVIKGYNDGATFNPTGNVTRAEMATMICRILAGGDNMIVDATKPVPTYTDIRNNPSAAWAESYIEYCTSLGIVSGKGNGIFDPSADVTAAEAAKMVMTTLGYNADIEQFKGIGWDINVMAKANTLQLLDNLQGEISSSVAVTREQVAQLLYNALGAHTVQNYVGTTANTWIGSGANAYHETLLESKFNAQKVTGVVIANEWADLYGEDPLSAGKTRVRVLGTDNMPTEQEYTVNLSTSLEQIGESIIVYRDTTSNRILFGNDQSTDMNVVNEFTAKGDITKSGDFENAIDKNALTKNTEYFVNFGDNLATTAEVDRYFAIKVKEVKAEDDPDFATTPDEKDLYYRVGKELSSQDYQELRTFVNTLIRKEDNPSAAYKTSDIVKIGNRYYIAIKFSGRATANEWDNTTDKVEYDDWKGFQNYYLTSVKEYNTTKFTENQNGNYIKTVDYNNDGEIDFVLQTRYTVTNVDRIRNDDVTLYLDNVNDPVNAKDKIDTIMPFDDLAEDDIVVYAVIDGVAHVYLTDMKTAKIDKVNRNKLTCTTTDGDEYVETGVDNNGVIDKALYYDDTVTGLAGGVTYNLHFDRYGYLAAFTEAGSANFTLLVDGWFNYARGGREYAVKAYIDGKIADRDVTRGGDLFIYDDDDKIQSLNNSWGLIKAFGTDGNINYTGNTGLKTIVASLNEDGVLTPVDRLSTNTSNKRVIRLIDTGKKVPTSTKLLGDAYSTSTTSGTAYNVNGTTDVTNGAKVEVRALNSTVYYYVYPSSSNRGNPIVREYTGYNRLPELKESEIEDVYTVGTMVNRDVTGENRTYFTANVVVVEVAGTYKGGAEEVLVVDTPVVGNGVTEDTLLVIRANGAMEEIQVDLSASKGVKTIEQSGMGSYGPAGTNKVMPGLYKIYETDKSGVYEIAPMSHADIRDSGRYAVGQVSTSEYTSIDQYVEVAGFTYASDADSDLNKTKTTTRIVKDITDSSKLYTLSYKGWNADLKDQTDWAEYMSEAVDRVNDSTGLNREFDVKDRNNEDTKVNANFNDVLIRYDKGNIVYAVSFANLISSREETTLANTNNAQRVWNNVKPDPKAVGEVTFFGQTDWVGPNADATTKDKSDVKGTIRVDYTDAKAWMETAGHKALTVDNADYWLLSTSLGRGDKNGQPALADGANATVTYYLTFVDKDGKDYNYELILEEADHDKELYYLGTNPITQIGLEWDHTGGNTTFKLLKDMYNVHTDADGKIDTTAEIESWTFFDSKGNVITDQSTSIVSGYYAEVVVADEGGNTQTFTIRFGRDDSVVTGAMDAIDGKTLKVYFNTANGKVNLFRTEADAEKNTGDTFIATHNTTAFASEDHFVDAARSVIVEALEEAGFGSMTGRDILNVIGHVSNTETDLKTTADKEITGHAYTAMILKSDLTTPEEASVGVQFIFVNTAGRTVGPQAKALIDDLTAADLEVYYGEWHANDGSNNFATVGYNKAGAAEYISSTEAAGLVKPNGTTIFDRSTAPATMTLGESALLAKINKLLSDAGIGAHLSSNGRGASVAGPKVWGSDGGDADEGDYQTFTNTYAILDDNNAASGTTVTITYTIKVVTAAWNDGDRGTYQDTVPDGYWA